MQRAGRMCGAGPRWRQTAHRWDRKRDLPHPEAHHADSHDETPARPTRLDHEGGPSRPTRVSVPGPGTPDVMHPFLEVYKSSR